MLRKSAGHACRKEVVERRLKTRPVRPHSTAFFIILGIIALLLNSGCNAPPLIKVGTRPVIDSLPLNLARHKPIFRENNLVVEPVYFERSADLCSALVDGKVDAIITDLLGALLLNKEQENGKIVRVALRASDSRAMFAIVTFVHPTLQNVRIAIPNEPMERYAAYLLLKGAGMTNWTEIEVPSPEIGLEKMRRGDVSATLVPEPYLSMALKGGAHVLLDDRSLTLGQTVVVFSERMVRQKPALVRRFLRAYEQSVRELNIRPQVYRPLAVEMVHAPPDTGDHLTLPVYPFPGEVPTESEIESANHWLLENRMLTSPVPYTRAANAGFLWDPYQFKPAVCCGW